MSPIVIAIAGPSGSGKTHLTQTLAKELGNAAALYFDDYDLIQNQDWFEFEGNLEELEKWIIEGFDPNKWETPKLIDHLTQLRNNKTVDLEKPNNDGLRKIVPASFVIVEYPLGREPENVMSLIDIVIHIDIPFEIALCRRLKRNLEWAVKHETDLLEKMTDDLTYYPRIYWPFYLAVKRRLEKSADLRVNGLLMIEKMVKEILQFLKNKGMLKYS